MRKFLYIFAAAALLLAVLSQILLPGITESTVESRLKKVLDTQEVQAHLASTPAILMAFGHLDSLDVQVERGRLGKVRTQLLHLTGKNVDLSSSLITDERLAVKSADSLKLEGVISEDNLKEYLEKNVKKLKKVQVKLTRSGVLASGEIMLAGKNAEIALEGFFEEDDNGIYLRTRNLDIRNSRLGKHLSLNLFENFLIVDFNKLSIPVALDEVVHEDGRAVVRASYHH